MPQRHYELATPGPTSDTQITSSQQPHRHTGKYPTVSHITTPLTHTGRGMYPV